MDRAGAGRREVDLEGERRLVRLVRPEAVVAWGVLVSMKCSRERGDVLGKKNSPAVMPRPVWK